MRACPPGVRQRGLSLLEVVVAVAVFAVVGAIAWGGLDRLLRARAVIDEQSAALQALQQAVGQFERDLRQAIARPVRDGTGATQPALRLRGDALALTRAVGEGGWTRAAPNLERVEWRCDQGRLERLRWPVLDRAPGTTPEPVALLEGLRECTWRAVGEDGDSAAWPLDAAAQEGRLPLAVEWRFTLANGESYRRLVELPAGLREAP